MMSVRIDCASGESGTFRRSSPAITSMPASGFFSSWAMPAAISPSAARRSRRRSRSSSCSTRVRSLKNSAAPVTDPSDVRTMRQRVADHLAGRLQPHLRAIRQVTELERAGDHPHQVVVRAQHLGVRAADVLRVGAAARRSGRPRRSSPPGCRRASPRARRSACCETMSRKKRSSSDRLDGTRRRATAARRGAAVRRRAARAVGMRGLSLRMTIG